ncbi:MAG: hypothetical protein KDD40_11000 [Bdellovibrionales bacterium]|nr:hypothetical protein [Bdellovibrionales bacterium]
MAPHKVPALSSDTFNTLVQCYGFVGECELKNLGLKLKLSFAGFQWQKPTPQFLNFTGWGDHSGWQWRQTYYGYRQLKIYDRENRELAHFKQFFWNSSAYADFNQILALDLKNRQLYVAQPAFGFNSFNEMSWAISY